MKIKNLFLLPLILLLCSSIVLGQVGQITLPYKTAGSTSNPPSSHGTIIVDGGIVKIKLSDGTTKTLLDSVAGGYVSNLTGTSNQITVSASTGAVTISLPSVIDIATGVRVAGAAVSGNYLRGNGTNFISSSLLASDISGQVAPGAGGTGLNGVGTANQILGVVNAGGSLEYKTLNGTTNQVTIVQGANSITFSLPQSIATTSTPTFAGLTITGLTGVLKASAGVLAGSATTSDLTEGSNLYYTDARARAAFSFTSPLSVSSGTVSIGGLSTIGTANYILGVNSGGTAYEYKQLIAGSNVTITHGANSVTIAASSGSGISGLTTNTIPKASSSTTIADSAITDDGTLISLGRKTRLHTYLEINNFGQSAAYIGYQGFTGGSDYSFAVDSSFNTYINAKSTASINFRSNGGNIGTATGSAWTFYGNVITGDGSFIFGAADSSHPALYYSGTEIQFKLGNAGGVSSLSAKWATFAVGTITSAQPVLDTSVTWNSAGVTFTGIKLNVTDTSSASASLLMDLQVGASSKFKVTKAGAATFASTIDVTSGNINANSGNVFASGGFTLNGGNWIMQANTTYTAIQFNQSGATIGHVVGQAVSAKTANFTISGPTDTNVLFNNSGAAGSVNFSLPAASVGLQYKFVVTDAQTFTITASTGDTIRIAASVSASAGNITTSTVGNTITLVCVAANKWISIGHEGTWTVN